MNRRRFTTFLFAVPPLAVASQAEAFFGSSSDADAAASMVSRIRARYGHGAVTVDPRMNAAAQQQATYVSRIGSLSHGDFAGRVRQHGLRGSMAENLAYGSNDVSGAIAQWQGSSSHMANLLKPGATRMGLARADNLVTRYWAMVIG